MSNESKTKDPTYCPHCGVKMNRWMAGDVNSWGYVFQYVCFNDECPYYVKGWEWMEQNFGAKNSYRHRYNPETGEKGPLPVFNSTALRSGIVEDDEEQPEAADKENAE